MKQLLAGAVLVAAVLVCGRLTADDTDKPKNDIGTVMEKAHKPPDASLRKKVLGGKAAKADAEALLALYVDLAKNEPPMGDKAQWKKRTDTIVAAAKKVAADPANRAARTALQRATNCSACHKVHRPK